MKFYSMSFGTGDPRTFSALSPTMLIFVRLTDGATIAPPSITESLSGSGMYQFQYGTTQPIAFLCDGASTNLGSGRYIRGRLDPDDRSDEYGNTLIAIGTTLIGFGVSGFAQGVSLFALGTTNVALGTSIYGQNQSLTVTVAGIGSAGSTFGDTTHDPTDLFGYNKRLVELLEGNAAFDKSAGVWSLYSRGSSTLLRTKTLTNATTGVTKS